MTGLDRAWSYPSHKHESSLWDTVAAKSTSQDRIGVEILGAYLARFFPGILRRVVRKAAVT